MNPLYFMRYSSLHLDFDKMKIAFPSPFDKPDEVKNEGKVAIIVGTVFLSLLALVLLVSGICYFSKQKRLQNNIDSYEQL